MKLNGPVALFAPHVTVPLYVASAGLIVNVPPLDVILTVCVPPPKVAGDALGEVEGFVLGEVEGFVLGEVEGFVLGEVEGLLVVGVAGVEDPPPPHATMSVAIARRPYKNRICIVIVSPP